jgi:hypothetical protein
MSWRARMQELRRRRFILPIGGAEDAAVSGLERWIEIVVLISLVSMIAFFVVLPISHTLNPRSNRAIRHRWSLPDTHEHESHPMPAVALDRG